MNNMASRIRETEVSVIYPDNLQNEAQATKDMAEAEFHNYGLEPLASENTQVAILDELKQKYDQWTKLQNTSVQNVEENPSTTHYDILALLSTVFVSYANHDIPKGHIILRAPVSLF